jgi:hypothetical protein
MQRLDTVRNSAAHGSRPTDNDMRRLLAQDVGNDPSDGTVPWFPSFWDKSSDIAHSLGLVLRHAGRDGWTEAMMLVFRGGRQHGEAVSGDAERR